MKKTIIFLFLILPFCRIYSQDTIRIFFNLNSRELSSTEHQKIDSLVKKTLENTNTPIVLVGYADYLGTKNYNMHLSEDRALIVKKNLLNASIKKDRFTSVAWKGKQAEIKNDPDHKGNVKDRRVDIIFHKELTATKEKNSTKKSSLKENVDKLKKGETMVFKNLNFIGGRHYLLPESYESLDTLLSLLKENTKLKIEIQGHICCDDGNADGLDFDTNEKKLSENRAKFIYDFLIKKGIDPTRMQYAGYGRKNPIIQTELTEEDRITNRRVEIKILDK